LPATGFSIELPRQGVPVLAGFAVRLADAKTPPFRTAFCILYPLLPAAVS
jgi:hypothetical protein